MLEFLLQLNKEIGLLLIAGLFKGCEIMYFV